MEIEKTLKVRITTARNWYKKGETYTVNNYMVFYDKENDIFTNVGDTYYKVSNSFGFILITDCEILNEPKELKEDLIPVPDNIKFSTSGGIISRDGKYTLNASARDKDRYYVSTRVDVSNEKHYLEKIDFKDIKPGDIICGGVHNNQHVYHYNVVISENEWRYWHLDNTAVKYHPDKDLEYYKVITQ